MSTLALPELMGRLDLPALGSAHPRRSLRYSLRLVKTIDYVPKGYATAKPGMADFYDMLKADAVIADAADRQITPSNAKEEQRIYLRRLKRSPGASKPWNVDGLRDYFGDNIECWYALEETLTGLRFRKADLRRPYNIGDEVTAELIVTNIIPYLSQIADPKFTRKNFKDIIGDVNQIRGEVAVPYARGHVIREMHPAYGIFAEVEQTTGHRAPYALHGSLPQNLDIPKDPISGQYDVAVRRGSGWHHDVDQRCLGVYADCERSDADRYGGFRLVVRGPFRR